MSEIRPRITITNCTQCRWLLRAAWLAQELLSTFATELKEVALIPGTGGAFIVTYNDVPIWERKVDRPRPTAAFPMPKR
jgi:selenoprotein W-related protein